MVNQIRRKLLGTAVAVAIGSTTLMASASAYAAEHNWRFSNLYGRGTAYGELYEGLAKNIETMSNNRIKVQVLYSGEGVGTSGLLAATKSGLVTMAAPFQSMHAGELPAGVVEIGLPGGTSDVGELYELFYEKGWDKVLKKAYSSHGLTWLDPYIQPPVYIITKKPIKSLDDFKGLKIRAPGAYGKFLRNLGASPVSLAWGEIYTSLATGVIDGSIGSNMIDHRDGNHVEVAKYMYKLPLAGAQVLPIVVNTKAWNKLSPDLQAIVHGATAIHSQQQMTKSMLWEGQAVKEMEAKGLLWSPDPSDADKKAWTEVGKSLAQEYAKADSYSKELVTIFSTQ